MILVTGGTGLVGSHLLYHLVESNFTVRAIYRDRNRLAIVKKVFSYYSDNFEELFDKIEWVECDITDVYQLENVFNSVSKVYHSAALVSFNPRDYKAMRKINIEGTANVVNMCIDKNISKLCYVSSIATIDKSVTKDVIDETEEWNPENNNYGYAITKYGAEMEVWRASQEGIPVVIVNPGVIMGAGFWDSGTGEMFSKIYKGLSFYAEGVTGFVCVKDVVNNMITLMESSIKNERFIVVAENRSFKNVFDSIAETLHTKKPSIKITPFMSAIAWRVSSFLSFFTGKAPLLTRHSAKSIHSKYYYSSKKLEESLSFQFSSVDDCIKTISATFLKEK